MYFLSGVLLIIASNFQFQLHNYLKGMHHAAYLSDGGYFIPIAFFIAGILCIVYHFKREIKNK